ncbi:hypothetical protein EV363DRAFT_1580710 [Boletus edulis]|nr:hypothetical protein EV363DRAFT_1580710 [Boletus edulis]
MATSPLRSTSSSPFDTDDTRPLSSRPSTPPTITNFPPQTASSHIAQSYRSASPPVSQPVPQWAQPARFNVNGSARSYAYGSTSRSHVNRGWTEYTLPDGARYYVNEDNRAITDLDIRNLTKLDEVSNTIDASDDAPEGCEIWIRAGSNVKKGWWKQQADGEPVVFWVDHHHRRVLGKAPSDDYVQSGWDDRLDYEYRYWAFIEMHPAHIPRGIVESARKDAIDVLRWSNTDYCLTHPESPPIPPPFSQDEYIELFKLLNYPTHPTSPTYTRIVARILLRAAHWHQVNFRPYKPLPRDVSYQQPARSTSIVEYFYQMMGWLGEEKGPDGERRSAGKLEHLGDTALDAHRHDEAITHYTNALSLDPASPDILIKRSKAHMATASWKEALNDANQAIKLDPLSPWGYEMKHAALHKIGDYDNAVDTFGTMLSKMESSADPKARQRRSQYKTPSSIRTMIRKIIKRTLRDSPHTLINTITGRLVNRDERASTFESLSIFNGLVSSMATRIDRAHIKREVRQYFRYVMLSHKWEDNEPLFQQVVQITVYGLKKSPTHNKLQVFCKIVRDAGFNWAWSDTCCIDQSDHFVLQEALVAMFRWYQGSALMIVFLRGVRPQSQPGALTGSIWNTRGWTLQEYIASKVVRFYTEDWTLYRDLELPNHKESPEIILEMGEATKVSAQQLTALRPGLTSIREKLRLASTRKTTRVEDTAYSLLGIFSVVGIPAIYGEGEASLGRLLANLLTRSGDVSILAWTGESGHFNSCLPARITVFNGPATSHLPSPIQDSEMQRIITGLHTPSFDLDLALRLYDRLDELPTPRFAESRMTLPCIAFQLPALSPYRSGSSRVYRAETIAFGMVEIKTRHNLSRTNTLYLVHPWLDTLLEREDMHSGTVGEDNVVPPSLNLDDEEIFDEETDDEETDDEEIGEEEIDDEETNNNSLRPEPKLPSYPALVHAVPMDRETGARRLVARLRQPFGALLITPAATRRRATDYRRVAADCLITVQFRENVSLADVLDNVRILDVL